MLSFRAAKEREPRHLARIASKMPESFTALKMEPLEVYVYGVNVDT
jgi:hypothetical protein